jgi:hypothetical protein
MLLNPFALGTSKRSQVMARIARLDRRQFHWGAASGTLGALVLCVEHLLYPLGRRSKFTRKPSNGPRFEWVRCNDVHLDVIALRAFVAA